MKAETEKEFSGCRAEESKVRDIWPCMASPPDNFSRIGREKGRDEKGEREMGRKDKCTVGRPRKKNNIPRLMVSHIKSSSRVFNPQTWDLLL